MSRILKRPMFRKGGNVGTGIMTGIVDRDNLKEGTIPTIGELRAPIEKELLEAAEYKSVDPLTKFLLTFGPAYGSATGPGGGVARALQAAQKPLAEMLADKEQQEKFKRDVRISATKSAMEKQSDLEKRAQEEKMFGKETERMFSLQGKEFEQAKTMFNLRSDFEQDQAALSRSLQMDIAKLNNIAKSKDTDKRIAAEADSLAKKLQNNLDMIQAERDYTSNIDNQINEEALILSKEQGIPIQEATNQETWRLKTTTELMKKGFDVGDEFITDVSKLKDFGKKQGKKGTNEGKIYYNPRGDRYYQLKGLTLVPFDIESFKALTPEVEQKEEIKVKEKEIAKPFGKKEYEESIKAGTDYLTKDVDMQNIAPENIIRPFQRTDLAEGTRPVSIYEEYLRDYRNR